MHTAMHLQLLSDSGGEVDDGAPKKQLSITWILCGHSIIFAASACETLFYLGKIFILCVQVYPRTFSCCVGPFLS